MHTNTYTTYPFFLLGYCLLLGIGLLATFLVLLSSHGYVHTRNRNAQLQLVKLFENTNVWLLPGEEGTLDGVGSSSVAGLGTAGVHALGGSPMI